MIDVEDSSWDSSTGFVLYLDGDGDGSGDENQILQRCLFSDGYALESGDCDDSNPLISHFDLDEDGFSSCDGDRHLSPLISNLVGISIHQHSPSGLHSQISVVPFSCGGS